MSVLSNFLLDSVHQKHVDKQFYVIENEMVISLSAKQEVGDRALRTARKLLDMAQTSSFPEEHKRLLVSCAYDYLRSMERYQAIQNEDAYRELLVDALLLVLKRSPNEKTREGIKEAIESNSDWYQFIINNRVHYQVHRQPFNFSPDNESVEDQICVAGSWSNFNELEKRKTANGFDFYKNENLLFSTDEKFVLKGSFWAGKQGILEGSPSETKEFEQFFKREPSGKYWLTLSCVVKDVMNIDFGKSHAYMGLEDAEGNFIYAGQYGMEREMTFFDYLTPFGRKPVGIETPDRYSTLPLAGCRLNEAKIELTSIQYKNLIDSIKQDKEQRIEGSLIKGNCTSYVKQKLDLIGIKAKTEMTAQEYLGRQVLRVLPKSWQKHTITFFKDRVPDFIKKVMCFNPIVYLPTLAVVCAARAFSGTKSDISLLSMLVKPWSLKIDHPVIFFEWLDECRGNEEDYKVFLAKKNDFSPIGEHIEQTTLGLGFKKADEGKVKLISRKHITQYQPKPLFLMAMEAIGQAIAHKLANWWSEEKRIDQNTLLVYLHAMKNQRFLTPFEFQNLKEVMDSETDFKREISSIISRLYDTKKIDRRSYNALKDLLKLDKIQDVLSYIVAFSLLNHLKPGERNSPFLQELMTPQVQFELDNMIKEFNETFSFSTNSIEKIQNFCSRVICCEWADEIDSVDTREEIRRLIISFDEKGFTLYVRKYFSDKATDKATTSLEKKILMEMSESIYPPDAGNVFVHFSHMIQTQKRLRELERDLAQLSKVIDENKHLVNEDTISDLKNLHQNIGVSLSNDAAYTGSATFYCAELGRLRKQWENIENIISTIQPAQGRLIPTPYDKDSWPDAGFREIKPLAVGIEQAKPLNEMSKKKVFFSYCSWGNGHRSLTDAVQKYISKDYRVVTCDVPDEVLIDRDPLFNLLGKGHSITTLYNTLVAGNYWDVIGILKKMGSSPTPDEELEIQKDLIRRKLLQELPDVIVSTYQKHDKLYLELAQELGIPFVTTVADMVTEVAAWETPPEYPHMRMLVPFDLPLLYEKLGGTMRREQVTPIGYPVRPEFLAPMDRNELRNKHGVAEDETVILCMNGGVGSNTPWPKLIANTPSEALGKCRLIVVAGKNTSFKEEVERLVATNPQLTIDVKGFVNAQEMAEITEIADVTVSKPGGGTVAESIYKKKFLLLDMRHSAQLPWEGWTGDVLKEYKLGMEISSEKEFIKCLQEAIERKEVPHVECFHGPIAKQTEQNFANAIQKMIQNAESDAGLQQHREKAFKDNLQFLPMREERGELGSPFEKQLAVLLEFNERINPKNILPSLKVAAWNGPYLRFDMKVNKFIPSDKFYFKDLQYAVKVAKKQILNSEGIDSRDLENILKMAIRAKKENRGNFSEIMTDLAFIDRYRVSQNCASAGYPSSIDGLKALYLSPVAKQQLDKWIHLQTSQARKKGQNAFMLDESDAIDCFVHAPADYDFVQNLHLHRKASAYNHSFTYNRDTHSLGILMQGQEVFVKNIREQFRYVNNRVIEMATGREWTYTFDQGLVPIENDEQHPYLWKNDIPLFKKKLNRKNKDYRLEVISAIGKESHGWVRLKDTEGNIYSMGRVWNPDYQLEQVRRCSTIPGVILAGGDLHEFLGKEDTWKTTKIVLNKDDFDKLKQRVIHIQKNDGSYNLINHNCVTFVSELLKSIGINHPTNETATLIFTPLPPTVKKFFIRHNEARTVMRVVGYPLTLVKNLFFCLFGMWKKRDVVSGSSAGFSGVWDFITDSKSLIDHFQALRYVQEIMEEDHANEDGKIYWNAYSGAVSTQLAVASAFSS